MRTAPATSLQSDNNVTPLVDVCLVLLIIFMVVTPMLVGIPVHLPQTATGDQLANKPIQIIVRADKALPYGEVVSVLDACRKAGFETVGLAGEKQPTGEN